MNDAVQTHYCSEGADLAAQIRAGLASAGKDLSRLTTTDLAPVDEFHIRGRQATLELAERMQLTAESHILDIGSGLGGPARTIGETYGCRVTGIDLTQPFCEAANAMSEWLGLADRVRCFHGDATALPFDDGTFDAAMTIHAGMNIPAKDALYAGARRVLKPGGLFAVYDVLQGEGGSVLHPVPWARDATHSYLSTPEEMRKLLTEAGFEILDEHDSTEASLKWFEEVKARIARSGPAAVTFQTFLGADFPVMARNQVQNLAERRIRTVSYTCRPSR